MRTTLVTGFPRSGTTFVGRILSTPARVAYLHEPLNPQGGLPAACQRFVDLDEPEHAVLAGQMDDLLRLRGTLRGAVWKSDPRLVATAKRVVRGRGPAQLMLARLPPRANHVLVKDPFALMSLSWFADRGAYSIVMVRHPAAVVASYRRLGWQGSFGFDRYATMGLLAPDELEVARSLTTDLERISMLWLVIHRAVVPALRNGEVVLHERLSADPESTFARLLANSGIPSSARMQRRLRSETSGRTAAADDAGPAQQFTRASADIAQATLERLTPDERMRVWEITSEVAEAWYGPHGLR